MNIEFLRGKTLHINIDGRHIGPAYPPYIIAEISANHNGSIDKAIEMIKLAQENGADAVKIQTYTADTMTLDCKSNDFFINQGPWEGFYLYDLYKWAETPFEWTSELINYGRKLGITIFSSPFDESAVDLLESLDVPAYKLASFEMTDLPLVEKIAKTKKPLIISTGMATEEEVSETLDTAVDAGAEQIVLLHCISGYPTPLEQANLNRIVTLRDRFDTIVGLSDHTIGNQAATVSIGLGASVIEKHFTISRRDKGPDSEFSMEPHELNNLTSDTYSIWKALGQGKFKRADAEKQNLQFRRSLYFCADAKAGDVVTEKILRRVRPGYGLAPKHYNDVIGQTLAEDVKMGTALSWKHLVQKK